MPIPATPPVGSAELNQNARTVIEKRYLIKDAKGKPTEQPEDMISSGDELVARKIVPELSHPFDEVRIDSMISHLDEVVLGQPRKSV